MDVGPIREHLSAHAHGNLMQVLDIVIQLFVSGLGAVSNTMALLGYRVLFFLVLGIFLAIWFAS